MHLAGIIESNPAYTHLIQSLDFFVQRGAKWREDAIASPDGADKPRPEPVERVMGLLGKPATRNVLLCLRMLKGIRGLPRSSKDQLLVDPKEQLKRALGVEEYCQENYVANPDWAFLGALHYDWISFRLAKEKGAPLEIKAALEEAWKEGFRIARIAYALGARQKDLKHQKYVFGAGLLLPLGRALMPWIYAKPAQGPSWKEFLADCEKYKSLKNLALDILEVRRFPVTPAEISGLIASFLGPYQPVEKSISLYQRPYYLKEIDPDQYRLSLLLSVAHSIQSGEIPDVPEKRRRILELGVPEKELLAIARKAKL